MKYRRKPLEIEAHQWYKNGDHPLDNCKQSDGSLWEGKIVRYYRHPNYPGHLICVSCGQTLHSHGWIDNETGGHKVCPGMYILKDDAGYYPVNEKIFEETFLSEYEFRDRLKKIIQSKILWDFLTYKGPETDHDGNNIQSEMAEYAMEDIKEILCATHV